MACTSAIQIFLIPTRSAEEARHKARLLLREGLRRWGLPHRFAAVSTDETGRPFVPPSPSLPHPPDVSFSHAPGLSAVVLGRGCRVGVDVEPLSTLFPPPMFVRLFTPAELAHPLADPVRLWTRKEALLKADGRGVSVDLAQLDAVEDVVEWDGRMWRLHSVDAGPEHACCVATDMASAVLETTRVSVAALC